MRRRIQPNEERGVYYDRDTGMVRAVTSQGESVVAFAHDGDLDAVIADAFAILDERDVIPHGDPLPLPQPPRHLHLL